MNFTKDDILKIKQALDKYGVKDTEFQYADTPISTKDIVTVVQDGQNKKIYVKEFVNELMDVFGESFINLTDRYGVYIDSLKDAIFQIPSRQRKEGLLITFLDNKRHWKLYQFQGSINQFNNPNLWVDLFNVESYAINSLLADEEDLTATERDNNGNSKIKLKDRRYDPNTFSGMGYKILRKNIRKFLNTDGTSDEVNYLDPNEFSDSNTIYEIRYDFDLKNKEIHLLENCILYYNGGSLNNGIIKCDNTTLQGTINNINITLQGTYNSINGRIDTLETKITDNKQSISTLNQNLNNEISDNNNEHINIKDSISQLSNTTNNNINNVKNDLQNLTKTVTTNKNISDAAIRELQPKVGTTEQRPNLTGNDTGSQFYDTTILSPMWWNGKEWKGTLSDITISEDGYWVIDEKKTEYLAVPIKPTISVSEDNKLQVTYDEGKTQESLGDTPVYTMLRVFDNKLQMSVDLGKTWISATDNIAAQFRWINNTGTDNIGKIQISRDLGKTWEDLSDNFTNNLCIKGYVSQVSELPTETASLGDIYMVGPTYSEDDQSQEYPHYRMYVKQSDTWIDNGEFTASVVGTSNILDKAITKEKLADDIIVQEFGQDERSIVSQKAVTNYLFGNNKLQYGLVYGTIDRNGNLQNRPQQDYLRTDYLLLNNQKQIYIKNGITNSYFFIVAFYDENKQFISAPLNSDADTESTKVINNAVVDVPENAKYVAFTLKVESDTLIYFDYSIPLTIATLSTKIQDLNTKIDNKKITGSDIVDLSIDNSKIQNKTITVEKTDFFKCGGKNRFNPNDKDIQDNYYLNQDGVPVSNNNYLITGYIPFTEEDGNLIASSNGHLQDGGGFIVLYNNQLEIVTCIQLSSTNGIATWQEGVTCVRYSLSKIYGDKHLIEVGTTVTSYEEYDDNYYLDTRYLPNIDIKEIDSLKSILGSDSIYIEDITMNNGTIYSIADFPFHMKKGNCISLSAKVSNIGTLLLGNGYNKYRGMWIKIDSSKVYLYRYESQASVVEETAHNLTIDKFINVSISHTEQGKLHIVICSFTGSFIYEFNTISFETNYEVFVQCNNSSITDFKLAATNSTFRYPVWAFGDSYFGVDNSRWIGQMKNYGYWNFLINGLAGQNSTNALIDLQKALNYGTPKYLLWCLGMNDQDSVWESVYKQVKSICNNKGIELIISTIPSVPTRNKEAINNIVKNSGIRYIDFAKAVGANSSGVWYDGYLSQDGVHPTALGAKALASRVLTDFSELMQYGLINN